MERKLRSRGIRIICKNDSITCTEKIYYEPDITCEHRNKYLADLQDKGLLSLFEYSIVDGQLDTYNFHVSLSKHDYQEIYAGESVAVLAVFDDIRNCFGDCMRNYTVGYRIKDSKIEKKSYYYYPTIWKGTRYGIKGITDSRVINDDMEKFAKLVASRHKESQGKIISFANLLYKFKGISIHPAIDNLGYKIYGCIEKNILKKYLLENYDYNLDQNLQYGECVLTALRVLSGQVQGINIYFLK